MTATKAEMGFQARSEYCRWLWDAVRLRVLGYRFLVELELHIGATEQEIRARLRLAQYARDLDELSTWLSMFALWPDQPATLRSRPGHLAPAYNKGPADD